MEIKKDIGEEAIEKLNELNGIIEEMAVKNSQIHLMLETEIYEKLKKRG